MSDGGERGLERALLDTEADADAALKAANGLVKSLRRFHGAARNGNLRDLGTAIAASEQALAVLRERFEQAQIGWHFDEAAYLEDGAYVRELLTTAAEMGVRVYQQDDRLYCYPSLVRVLGRERAVLIDKSRERRLRPSVLIGHLQDLQQRRPRFRSEAFLESLFNAYSELVARHGRGQEGRGIVEKLVDVYRLFTLAPGAAREYSLQEFARDLYLLDQSGITSRRGGYELSLSADAGTRRRSELIRVITQDGGEKLYYGLAFRKND
jgi:hypothetical protein